MANAQKPPEKKVEKVVDGVTIKKKSTLAKIRDMFIAEDADKVGSYLLTDVIVPAVKKTIVDMIKSGADMIFGTKGSSSSTATRYTYGGTPYVQYSSSNKKPETRDVSRSQYEIGNFIFNSKDDADKVIDNLNDLIEAYGMASVADLCELVGAPYEFVANKYGWKNLHDAISIRTPDGYSLRLPKSMPLE